MQNTKGFTMTSLLSRLSLVRAVPNIAQPGASALFLFLTRLETPNLGESQYARVETSSRRAGADANACESRAKTRHVVEPLTSFAVIRALSAGFTRVCTSALLPDKSKFRRVFTLARYATERYLVCIRN